LDSIEEVKKYLNRGRKITMKKSMIIESYKNEIKKIIKDNSLTKDAIYQKLSEFIQEKPYLTEFEKAFEELYYGDELIINTRNSSII
jgi:hypothetical protein